MSKTARYINIYWQDGVIPEVGVNGCQVEDVIEVVLERLQSLNEAFPCRENSITITKLQEAAMWQRERTRERQARGVEGQHVK